LAFFDSRTLRPQALLRAALLCVLWLGPASPGTAADPPPAGAAGPAEPAGPKRPSAPRVEARSADLLTVGVVQNDRMSIHISRLTDNAPLRDAVVTVALRGRPHPTIAEADGSYTLVDADLKLPGAAAVEFQISQGARQETLKGTLEPPAGTPGDEKSQARQYWWWALNFGVCIGFLVLLSRRKKRSAD
jgi:hypothetical protein